MSTEEIKNEEMTEEVTEETAEEITEAAEKNAEEEAVEGTEESTESPESPEGVTGEKTEEEIKDDSTEIPIEEDDSVSVDSEETSEGVSDTADDDDMQAKYVRLMAEFQNYKKRTAKEKEDIYSYGSEKIMTALTDVLDNFERALEQGSSDEKYAEGMNLIFTQFTDALKKCGLEEIEALGEDFDPNFHNAVLMEDSEEYESGKVSCIVQKGYKLNGKVIRPAMVKVAN